MIAYKNKNDSLSHEMGLDMHIKFLGKGYKEYMKTHTEYDIGKLEAELSASQYAYWDHVEDKERTEHIENIVGRHNNIEDFTDIMPKDSDIDRHLYGVFPYGVFSTNELVKEIAILARESEWMAVSIIAAVLSNMGEDDYVDLVVQ